MNWFRSLRLTVQLLLGFTCVTILTAFIGYKGYQEVTSIDEADTVLYEKMTVPLNQLSEISTAFWRLRVTVRAMIDATDPEEVAKHKESISQFQIEISKNAETFEKTILSEDGRRLFDEFKQSHQAYMELLKQVIRLDDAKKDAEALSIIRNEGNKAAKREQEAIDKLQEAKIKMAKQTADDNDVIGSNARKAMIILSIVGAMLWSLAVLI